MTETTISTFDATLEVRAMRHSLGLTQTEFGSLLGVSRRTIDRWEHGAPIHQVWLERLVSLWQRKRPGKPMPTESEEPS